MGIVYPQSPNFANTDAWGRYGPTREAARIMQDAVQDLVGKYSNFIVLDENRDGHHDFASEDFFDADHLCSAGAQVMSSRFDSLLKTLR